MGDNHKRAFDNIGLTEKQKIYIEDNWRNKSDVMMGKLLKVSHHIIRRYRRGFLNIKKSKGRISYYVNQVSSIEVNEEIKALQLYANFQSFMNGAHDRMKYLLSFRDGKR